MRNVWRAFAAIVVLTGLARAQRTPDTVAGDDRQRRDQFVFDAAARFNESLIANIDAADNVLTAVLAGVLAVAVFTIDKIRELQIPDKWIALSLLSAATCVCVAGYLTGIAWRGVGSRDGVRPKRFIPEFARRSDEATADAIRQLSEACEANLSIRRRKRLLAIVALVMLVAGTVVVAVARLHGMPAQAVAGGFVRCFF